MGGADQSAVAGLQINFSHYSLSAICGPLAASVSRSPYPCSRDLKIAPSYGHSSSASAAPTHTPDVTSHVRGFHYIVNSSCTIAWCQLIDYLLFTTSLHHMTFTRYGVYKCQKLTWLDLTELPHVVMILVTPTMHI